LPKEKKTVKLPPPIVIEKVVKRRTDPLSRQLSQSLSVARAAARFVKYKTMGVQYQALRQGGPQVQDAPKRRRKKSKGTLVETEALRQAKEEAARWKEMYVPDDKWEEATTTVWFPVAPRKRMWDNWMLVVLVYSIIVEPYRIAFNAPASGNAFVVESFFSIVFMFDIVFTFNTAYIDVHENWVIDRRMITMHYVQGRFPFDVLGSYPAELIEVVAVRFGVVLNSSPLLRASRLLRLLRVLRVLRELRAIFEELLITLESRFQSNLAAFHLIGPMCILIYLMHLLACSFVMVGQFSLDQGYEESWLTQYHEGKALSGTYYSRYLMALYWASGTTTGLGTAVLPENEWEWLFVSCAHAFGVVIMGSIIGWIARAIESSQSPIEKTIESKLEVVKDITRFRGMPPDLADHVIRFYSHYSRKHAQFDEEDLIEALRLAPTLRREVLKHLLGKSVAVIPIFEKPSYATDEFQLAVAPMLKPSVHEPGELLVEQYTYSHQLLFMSDGMVKCGTTISGHSRMLYTVREEGDLMSEHCLLEKASDVWIEPLSRCDIFRLALDDLERLMERFPDAREEFAEHVIETLIYHQRQRYFSLRMSQYEMKAQEREGRWPEMTAAAMHIQIVQMRRQLGRLSERTPQEIMPHFFRCWGHDEPHAPSPEVRLSRSRRESFERSNSRGLHLESWHGMAPERLTRDTSRSSCCADASFRSAHRPKRDSFDGPSAAPPLSRQGSLEKQLDRPDSESFRCALCLA